MYLGGLRCQCKITAHVRVRSRHVLIGRSSCEIYAKDEINPSLSTLLRFSDLKRSPTIGQDVSGILRFAFSER